MAEKENTFQSSLQEIDHLVKTQSQKQKDFKQLKLESNKRNTAPPQIKTSPSISIENSVSKLSKPSKEIINHRPVETNILVKNNKKETQSNAHLSHNGSHKAAQCKTLTNNVLNQEKDNELFAQLTDSEKIEKFLTHYCTKPVPDIEKKKENTENLPHRKNDKVLNVSCNVAETMTPQSRSKFEHLIKNLKESNEDEKLVVYKVMEVAETHKNIKITDFVPYKGEPKVRFSQYLKAHGCSLYVKIKRKELKNWTLAGYVAKYTCLFQV